MLRSDSEIGSEFWLDYVSEQLLKERDGVFVLSGRTAIDLIIQDISKRRHVKTVYLPAYCCDSMLDPFIKRGVEIMLYDLSLEEGQLNYDVDIDKTIDVFYVNNYFGYENTICGDVIKHFKQKGVTIIYDKTHSLFMNHDETDIMADYSFVSIRKWMGVVAGAVVWKKAGTMDAELTEYPHLLCKEEAMREKLAFISGDASIDKQAFLDKYGKFGHYLSDDYQNYRMDDLSYTIWSKSDKVAIRKVRRENAQELHMGIKFQFLGKMTANACPLFVPILLPSTDERDRVRKALIERQIYCPIHWSKNQLITPDMKVNNVFDRELSLICDQRYTVEHMQRIIQTIKSIKVY